uniref:Uncharacterized protein n=1 Tax=Aegilops tauschii subsp. strangulata TaxID=200361 RepID=A0A453IYX8_AEGTS
KWRPLPRSNSQLAAQHTSPSHSFYTESRPEHSVRRLRSSASFPSAHQHQPNGSLRRGRRHRRPPGHRRRRAGSHAGAQDGPAAGAPDEVAPDRIRAVPDGLSPGPAHRRPHRRSFRDDAFRGRRSTRGRTCRRAQRHHPRQLHRLRLLRQLPRRRRRGRRRHRVLDGARLCSRCSVFACLYWRDYFHDSLLDHAM